MTLMKSLKDKKFVAEQIFNNLKEKEMPELLQSFIVGMKLVYLGKILKKKGGDK